MTQLRGDIPDKIDRYEIIEAIGYGAMGAVFKAFDPIIKRPVAVKTLRLDVPPSSPDYKAFLERFDSEARTAGRLSHPNVVTLYDVGRTPEQVPWLAMEYVDGQTVAELLEGPRLRPEVVIGLVSQMASAIDYANTEGVVHRDIKPSNVIVFGGEKVKVTDFGIAKLMDAEATHSGIMMGTPSYMSPEQAMGEDLDGRTDIFSLGVVAFEMLSGQQPFPGNNVTSILYKLVHADPVQPDDLEVLGLLPHKWHEVFSRVLAKNPAERYPTAAAFVQDLELCLGSWFGALEGETVIVKESPRTGESPAVSPGADSDETVVFSKPEERDQTVRVELPSSAAPAEDATVTMAGGIASFPEGEVSEETAPAPVPPLGPAEETLYAGPEVGETLVAPPAAAAASSSSTATIRRRSPFVRRHLPVIVGAIVAIVVAVLFVRRPPSAPSASSPLPVDESASAGAAEALALPEMGSLRVATEPEGAVVFLDGQEAGLAPIDFPQIPLGTHEVRVELEGFHPASETADLTPEAPSAIYEIALEAAPRAPRPTFLRVESQPNGAQVQIDGRTVGNTPVERVRVEPGPRTLRVLLEGFLPWEDSIRVREGRVESVQAILTPRAPVAEPEPEAPEMPVPPPVSPGQLVGRGEPGVVDPKCVRCPAVPYPAAARQAKLEGVVELDYLIDENGGVEDLRVTRSGGEIFDAAVVEVVRGWQYQPATKQGVPVKMRWTQRFRFQQGR